MAKTSILMPVYNEVNFIRRTLESVVGEADEIIISDNCSTDGTSEICREFAEKYPEIKYFRQEKNIGSTKNFNYVLSVSSGEYIRFVGGHDVISKNSTKYLAQILDNNPDASLAFSKNIVVMTNDYSFKKLHNLSSFNIPEYTMLNHLCSQRADIRVTAEINGFLNAFAIYGMFRKDLYIQALESFNVIEKLHSDIIILTITAMQGKIIADNNSTYYAMTNSVAGEKRTWTECFERIVRNCMGIPQTQEVNASAWKLNQFFETYELLQYMKSEQMISEKRLKKLLNTIMDRLIETEEKGFRATTELVTIIEGKQSIVDECLLLYERYKNSWKRKVKKHLKNNIFRREKYGKTRIVYIFKKKYEYIKS